MWESIMKIKKANLKISGTGEAIWASQSKTREERIRGRKISTTLRLAKEFVYNKTSEVSKKRNWTQTTVPEKSTTSTRR